MVKFYSNILSNNCIDILLNHSEVNNAKKYIDLNKDNSIYFSIPLTGELREELSKRLEINLNNVKNIPMRWIKGDTKPHIDKGGINFKNTYLIYLNDSEGTLEIENESYPIIQNIGYVFSEGLNHSTINTGNNPRLLLGPMNEEGLAVGAATTIIADGQTDIIYFKSSGLSIEYKINNGSYNSFSLPVTIVNSNTPFQLKVLFENDITIQSDIMYFICGSDGIQFGNSNLNNDGTRPVMIVDGVINYPGLIQNGTSSFNGYNNIYVYNLVVTTLGGSTLSSDGGWIGQSYFGRASINNFIVNCYSDGPIIDAGGGIMGGYCSSDGGTMTIIGCSSSGNLATYSGGIIGFYAGQNLGNVICEKCWSTGLIGPQGGGIVGYSAGENGSNVTVLNCYSSGFISVNAGGIFGKLAGTNGETIAQNCYSLGTIDTDGGGIYGSDAATSSGSTTALNCYSVGNITTVGNGIYGSNKQPGSITTNCYIANGSWDTTSANTQLTGFPISPSLVGSIWVYAGINQPYILRNMGYSPYTITNIIEGIPPELNTTFSQTIESNESSNSAIISNKSYTILQITP